MKHGEAWVRTIKHVFERGISKSICVMVREQACGEAKFHRDVSKRTVLARSPGTGLKPFHLSVSLLPSLSLPALHGNDHTYLSLYLPVLFVHISSLISPSLLIQLWDCHRLGSFSVWKPERIYSCSLQSWFFHAWVMPCPCLHKLRPFQVVLPC